MNNEMDKNNIYLSGAEAAASRAVEQARQDIIEENRKKKAKLIKLGAMMTAIGVILVFATRSWFTMSREAGGTGARTIGEEKPFRLAVTGDNIGAVSYEKYQGNYTVTPVNSLTGAIKAKNGDPYTYNDTTYYTADVQEAIKWRLSSANDPKSEIGPGSGGSFDFYIIPTDDKGFTAILSTRLDGYYARVSVNSEENDEDHDGTFAVSDLAKIVPGSDEYAAVEYLNRHMLFFLVDDDGTEQFIDEEKFELTITDAQAKNGVPIRYTVRWVWPKTFAQMACIASSNNAVSSEETELIAQIRNYIIADPEKVFDVRMIDAATAWSKMADSSTDPETGETIYTFNPTKAQGNLTDLSSGYNVADGEIGKNVKYLLMRLSADYK